MPHVIDYRGLNTDAGPSPNLWYGCDILEIMRNPNKGYIFFDDFTTAGLITSPTTEAALGGGSPYSGFGSANSTMTDGADLGGSLLLTEATNNEGLGIRGFHHPFKIAVNGGELWFEARVKVLVVTDTAGGIFCGLGGDFANSATVPIAADGTLASVDLVGFHLVEDDGDAIDSVYSASTGAVTVETGIGVVAAATYFKCGFHFDGKKTLSFYYNGVKSTTTYTVISTAGNPFPNDVQLAPRLTLLEGAVAGQTAEIDWWRCVQLRA